MEVNELVYWNSRTYGKALKIKKRWIQIFLIFFCLSTPGTNWAIPFIKKWIRNDFIYRFDNFI